MESSSHPSAELMDRLTKAHAKLDDEELARLRSLSMAERGELIVVACEAAEAIERSRRAAGLPEVEPDPWPASTWQFLKENAARART